MVAAIVGGIAIGICGFLLWVCVEAGRQADELHDYEGDEDD